MLAVLLVAGTFLLVFGIVLFGGWVMAKLSEVTDALAAQTTAINDLAARIPQPGAASEADLDGVKQAVEANTAQIAALAPPTA